MSPPDRPEVIARILDAVRGVAPPSILPVFQFCLEHADEPLTVETVARACGIKRRALEYRHHKAGLLPPGTCIARCRLLLAVHRLERPAESLEDLAIDLGYGTASALRKSVARHIGEALPSLRKPGAFDRTLLRFVTELRQRR